MGKSKLLAAVLAASLALSASTAQAGAPQPGIAFGTGGTAWVWGIFGCSGGIILSAIFANWAQHRQLTWNEAATCGLLYWFNPNYPK
jgi:hypothetical protein